MSEAPAPQSGTVSLRIGALAAPAEVTVDTLRLYKKLVLLPRPARTPAANLLSFDFGAPTGAQGLLRAPPRPTPGAAAGRGIRAPRAGCTGRAWRASSASSATARASSWIPASPRSGPTIPSSGVSAGPAMRSSFPTRSTAAEGSRRPSWTAPAWIPPPSPSWTMAPRTRCAWWLGGRRTASRGQPRGRRRGPETSGRGGDLVDQRTVGTFRIGRRNPPPHRVPALQHRQAP